MALLIHLYFAAFFLPYIGGLVLIGPEIAGQLRSANDVVFLIVFLLISPGFLPFIGWSLFVPAGCFSFLFFRATATRHAKGKAFWMVAWALIGGGTGAAYAFMTGDNNILVARFICSGAVAGLVLARWHRRVWIGLYPEADPRSHMPESTGVVRA